MFPNSVSLNSSRLKNLLLICILALGACQTDLLIPCNEVEELTGEICREFIEVNDLPVGTVEYSYDPLKRVNRKTFKNNANSTEKTLSYEYANNRVSAIIESTENASSRIAYGFDEADSLVSVAYFSAGQIDSLLFIGRMGGKRISERLEVSNDVVRFQEYRYRQSDGVLDRISFYTADSVLRFYQQYEFFQDGTERIEKRSTEHLLQQKTVIRRNSAGQTTLVEIKDPQDEPLETSTFTYDADGGIICAELVKPEENRKTTYLYY